ncbi:D-amino-acid oxidase [Colletotrichum gloeosporioides]|uniref:D-amino-acid oxidase n=1 Tax=Colletotrichum gloeosporioides TaxID=474922 RepID=A0A8H4FM38_COLGL|nr:D-amino-acid oxidase [Colletotrichum gloeosporioides]KAF3807318.1 D-amino-acid oxidase [Colletotrichum gloeosporioides]
MKANAPDAAPLEPLVNSIVTTTKQMPGDYDIEYASPWAGAAFQPYILVCPKKKTADGNAVLGQSCHSWHRLSLKLVSISRELTSNARTKTLKAMTCLLDHFSLQTHGFVVYSRTTATLKQEELPKGVDSGFKYTGVCINTSLYLPWLLGQCRAQGVILKRGAVSHIDDLKTMHHSGKPADVLVNASGLLARDLGGVLDKSVVPIRGQTVLVRNEAGPLYNISGTDDGDAEISYLMMRASGGGTVLGGTYDKGNWSQEPDMNIAKRIIKRCVALSPQLANEKGVEGVEIIGHGVGLRPWRKDGIRLETDFDFSTKETLVVHNYGHAGWGYQGSYGCAEYVVELVEGFQKDRNVVDEAKLWRFLHLLSSAIVERSTIP